MMKSVSFLHACRLDLRQSAASGVYLVSVCIVSQLLTLLKVCSKQWKCKVPCSLLITNPNQGPSFQTISSSLKSACEAPYLVNARPLLKTGLNRLENCEAEFEPYRLRRAILMKSRNGIHHHHHEIAEERKSPTVWGITAMPGCHA